MLNDFITLTIADGGPGEVRALRAWLTREEELRGRVTLTQHGPPGAGTLGGALEALSVSIESGGSITVLIAGILSWLRQRYGQRGPQSTTVIKLRRTDGATVEISAATAGTWSAAESAEQARQLVQALDPGNQGAGNHPG
jgi:Effector Associated Constant Component 1